MARIMGDQFITPAYLLDQFSRQRILVVGDVMLDWFIWGGVSRISPEAPVPVVEVQRESRYPGGAANVARNITPFGSRVDLSGLYGEDPNGALLLETLSEAGIGVEFCLQEKEMQTITKTRVVAQHQQVVRIDREKCRPISETQEKALLAQIEPILSEIDGLIIEDYGKGLVTPGFVSGLLRAAEPHDIVITVDPKPGNPIEWRGVTTVKPNRSEAFASAGIQDFHRDEGVDPFADEPLLETGRVLLEKWACHQILLTLGEQGMLVFTENEDPRHIPARAREVFDVSGAGDTAIAIYTLGLCAGLEASIAAGISNLASSIVVGKLGTTPIEREELLEAIVREYPGGIPNA
ncbi:MAG: PfkB family carbohydrate kinase [Verrucomicrobiales bacterium]|nr:PfkB family carbohydrate kinase [Verrucomicrobiales bacterium]